MKGYAYILLCADDSYYTGSTKDLVRRLEQHQNGEGGNHTKKRLPVKLIYFEQYSRIDEAFYREKQIQGWSRKKKEALINGASELLPELAKAYRDIKDINKHFKKLGEEIGKKNKKDRPSSASGLGYDKTEGSGP